jgi:hypothetical protein
MEKATDAEGGDRGAAKEGTVECMQAVGVGGWE